MSRTCSLIMTFIHHFLCGCSAGLTMCSNTGGTFPTSTRQGVPAPRASSASRGYQRHAGRKRAALCHQKKKKNEPKEKKVIVGRSRWRRKQYLPISWQLPCRRTSPPALPAWLSAPLARGPPFFQTRGVAVLCVAGLK